MSEKTILPKSNNKKLKCCFRPPFFQRKAKEEQQSIAVPLLFLRILLSILSLGTIQFSDSSKDCFLATNNPGHISFHEKLIQNVGVKSPSTSDSGTCTSKSKRKSFPKKILERISILMALLKHKLGFSSKTETKKRRSCTKPNFENEMFYCHREILPNMNSISFVTTDAHFRESRKEAIVKHEPTKVEKIEFGNKHKQLKRSFEKGPLSQNSQSAIGDNLPGAEAKKDSVSEVNAVKVTLTERVAGSKLSILPKILTVDSSTSTTSMKPEVRKRSSVTSVKQVKKILKKVFPKLSKIRSKSSTRSKSKLSLLTTNTETTKSKKCTSDTYICIAPVSSEETVAATSVSEQGVEKLNERVSAHTKSSYDSEKLEIYSLSSSNNTNAATINSQSLTETESDLETNHSDAFCSGDAPPKDEDKISFKSLDLSDVTEPGSVKEEFFIARLEDRTRSEFPNLFQTIWQFPEKLKVDWNQFVVTKPTRSFVFQDGKARRNQKIKTPTESAV